MSDDERAGDEGGRPARPSYPPGTLRIGSIAGVDVLVRSSWLLVAPPWVPGWPTTKDAGMGWCCWERRLLGGYELLPTRRPVVTMSSPMDDSDDEEG